MSIGIENQKDILAKMWEDEIENFAKEEFGKLKSVFLNVVESIEDKKGKTAGILVFLRKLNKTLNSARTKGIIDEEKLEERLELISDPAYKKAVEVSGRFLIKIQRETTIPSFYSQGFLFEAMNEAFTEWEERRDSS